jgi:hypothetical protein
MEGQGISGGHLDALDVPTKICRALAKSELEAESGQNPIDAGVIRGLQERLDGVDGPDLWSVEPDSVGHYKDPRTWIWYPSADAALFHLMRNDRPFPALELGGERAGQCLVWKVSTWFDDASARRPSQSPRVLPPRRDSHANESAAKSAILPSSGPREDFIRQVKERWLQSYHEFFYDLDRETDSTFKGAWRVPDPDGLRAQSVDALVPLLKSRLMERARERPRKPLPREVNGKRKPTTKEAVRCVSKLILDLIDSNGYFREVSGESRVKRVGLALESFACGDLKIRWPGVDPIDGQPNSAAYFFLAEFAMLACELGVDRDRWSRLLEPMVRTQLLYTMAYGSGDGSPLAFEHYQTVPGRAPRRIVSFAERERVRAEFHSRRKDVEWLTAEATRIAQRSLVVDAGIRMAVPRTAAAGH